MTPSSCRSRPGRCRCTTPIWCIAPDRTGPGRRRIGLGISYIPTHVRCHCRPRLSAMLVRGTDRYGHFDDEKRPRTDYGAAERAFHATAVARFREANAEE